MHASMLFSVDSFLPECLRRLSVIQRRVESLLEAEGEHWSKFLFLLSDCTIIAQVYLTPVQSLLKAEGERTLFEVFL